MGGARSVYSRLAIGVVVVILGSAAVGAATVTTKFTYQGQLQRAGGAFTGTCTMQFSLWDSVTDGVQRATTLTVSNVAVSGGVFTVTLDFGDEFPGNARWLQTAVQCGGDSAFTMLAPRQEVTATPYALSLRPGALVLGDLPGQSVLTARNVDTGNGSAFTGLATGGGPAVTGTSNAGTGIAGMSDDGVGVSGKSANGTALYGESASGVAIDANGLVKVEKIDSGVGSGTEPLCRNGAMLVATCSSSSFRYKQDVTPLRDGLDLVNRLQPISFSWKGDGTRDLGLGAEDVAAVAPLLVTHNDRGEIEGVRYDRLGPVLINAIKQQQAEIEVLKHLVCLDHPEADVCRR